MNNKIVSKVSQILVRENGEHVKITAHRYHSTPGSSHSSVDVMVHHRKSENENWSLCKNRPDPKWKKMSVDEYLKSGRAEMFKYVSIGEILKVSSLLSM